MNVESSFADLHAVHEAIMIVDCVGSSQLAAKFGNRVAAVRKADLEKEVRFAVKKFGAVSKCNNTGDGFFTTFKLEYDAACCAIAILDALPSLNEFVSRRELELHLRIGLTFGELTVNSRGERQGEAANLCARLESMGPDDLFVDAGGLTYDEFSLLKYDRILVSGEVYDGIKMAYPMRYVGLLKPKGIRRRYEVFLLDSKVFE